jgi:hypothetical protein
VTTRRRSEAEPIEDYLDELLSCLRLPPRATRRLLGETEDHLRQAADEAERAGASRVDAERVAVAQFGGAARVAAAASGARRTAPGDLVGALAWSAVTLAGVGLAAVGVSGVLAGLFDLLAGRRFVGGLPGSYSASTCGHFLALHPFAPTCGAAAVLENSHDAVALRAMAGLVGLVLIGVAWATSRYLNADPSFRRIVSALVSAAAALAFAVAAAFLFGQSLVTAMHHGSGGVGWYLTGGIASGLGAVVAVIWCWQQVRALRPWNHVAVSA